MPLRFVLLICSPAPKSCAPFIIKKTRTAGARGALAPRGQSGAPGLLCAPPARGLARPPTALLQSGCEQLPAPLCPSLGSRAHTFCILTPPRALRCEYSSCSGKESPRAVLAGTPPRKQPTAQPAPNSPFPTEAGQTPTPYHLPRRVSGPQR